jgi:hypothetical protein
MHLSKYNYLHTFATCFSPNIGHTQAKQRNNEGNSKNERGFSEFAHSTTHTKYWISSNTLLLGFLERH